LALTSPTSGGRSVGIVLSRTIATELVSYENLEFYIACLKYISDQVTPAVRNVVGEISRMSNESHRTDRCSDKALNFIEEARGSNPVKDTALPSKDSSDVPSYFRANFGTVIEYVTTTSFQILSNL
jgi:hypothetical protein